MANTYRKIYLQVVFAVKNKNALLHKTFRDDVFKYISGIINNRGHYSLAVNGTADHIHLFFDYSGNELISDLVREIKKSSTLYIQKNKFLKFKFEWQVGYGVFSHGYREKEIVIEYIRNQEEHHKKISFKDEYTKFLKSYHIEFKDQYAFDFIFDK